MNSTVLDDPQLSAAWWGIVAAISIDDHDATQRAVGAWNARGAELGWTDGEAGFQLTGVQLNALVIYARELGTPFEAIAVATHDGDPVDPDTLTGEPRGAVLAMRALTAAQAGDNDIAAHWLHAATSEDEVTGLVACLDRLLIDLVHRVVAEHGPIPAHWHLPA